MKTTIVLFSICALSVIAVGAGLGPANRSEARTLQSVPVAVAAVSTGYTAATSQRVRGMTVMPAVTVVASAEQIAALDDPRAADRSVMLEAAVDKAGNAIVEPIRSSLPRARLGNPFYDFGRGRSAVAVAE